MNQTIRKGLDIQVLFDSNLKRSTDSGQKTAISNAHEPVSIAQEPVSNAQEPLQKPSLLKRSLRGVVRYAYRLAKPIMRPIAFRTRRYLTADLQQQIHETADLQRQIRGEIRTEVEGLRASSVTQLGMIESYGAALQQQIHETADLQRQIRGEIRAEVEGLRASLVTQLGVIESYGAASARRIAIGCGPDEVMVRTEVGFLLCAASDHALLACLLDTGELERGTRMLIQKYLRPGDVYVDIGANIGIHTMAAARAMQGKGKIIAFEPFAGTMRMLEKSIFLNGFSGVTELHEAAVSNSNGRRLLFLGATSGHHSLYSLETQTQGSQGPIEVKVVCLESALPSNQRIDLLKIDAEGAELEVLEGGMNLITTNPDIALIVEFGPSHLRRVGHTPRQWLDSFTHFGFDYRAINPDTGMLEEWSIGALEQVESINLFFARPGSTAWTRIQ